MIRARCVPHSAVIAHRAMTGHHSGGHPKLRGIGLKELPPLREGLLLDPDAAPLNLFAMSSARILDARR